MLTHRSHAALTPRRYSPVLMAMRHKSSAKTISTSVTNLARRIFALTRTRHCSPSSPSGCMSDQIDATNKLVQQQQEQLEHQQQELEALQANQNQNYTPGAATASLTAAATSRWRRSRASAAAKNLPPATSTRRSDTTRMRSWPAPTTTGPKSTSRAPTRRSATKSPPSTYYRKAADTNSATVSDAQDEAKAALLRLQASRMP